jgi:hypothetical protein
MQIRVAASPSNPQPVEDIVVAIGSQQKHPVRALKPGDTQEFTVSLRTTQSMILSWRAGDRLVSWEGPDLDARRIRALHLLVELHPDPKHPVRHRLIRR